MLQPFTDNGDNQPTFACHLQQWRNIALQSSYTQFYELTPTTEETNQVK